MKDSVVIPGPVEPSVVDAEPHCSAPSPAPAPSCADWVEGRIKRTLTDFQRRAVDLVVGAMNTGVYNLNINWEKALWDKFYVRFTMYSGGLSTFDFDQLTRFVIAAHDHCIRVDIAPASRQYLYLFLSPRTRDGGMSQRHPTLEQAVATFRGAGGSSPSTTDPDAVPGMDIK